MLRTALTQRGAPSQLLRRGFAAKAKKKAAANVATSNTGKEQQQVILIKKVRSLCCPLLHSILFHVLFGVSH